MAEYIQGAFETVAKQGKNLGFLVSKALGAAGVAVVQVSERVAPSAPPNLDHELRMEREFRRRENAEVETTVDIMKELPRSLRGGDELHIGALPESKWRPILRGAQQIGLLRVGFTTDETMQIMNHFWPLGSDKDVTEDPLAKASELPIIRAIDEERPFHS